MSESYRYLAFISYKREDEEWAKWLQHKLEHYKLPTAVRKANPSLPDRIRPIFKDTTDLSGGVLEKAIKDALESSKYLIVICSPLAAHSPWVCKEVQEFIDTGREEFIIPFIVEGEPHSRNIVNECFPQNLRELSGSRELLGININEMGRDAAAIKVAARMFDLHFDELWQRWERENRIRRRIVVAVSLLGAIVGLAIAGIMFYQNRKILINRARAVAYRATHLVEQGNSYLARKVLVEVLSDAKSINSMPEVESALRAACADNSWAFKFNSSVESVKYSPDGSKLAVGTSYYDHEKDTTKYSVIILDSSNGEVLHHCYGHADHIMCVTYSPDGNYIASASVDKTIRIWDINDDYKCVKILDEHERKVRSVSFSPDGKHLASASDDNTIRIWDIDDNYNCIKIIDEFDYYVTSVSYSSNGDYLLSSSADFSVKIWDVNADYKCIKSLIDTRQTSIFDTSQSVYSASFSPDGRYIVASLADKTLRVWDVYNNYQCKTLKGHKGQVFSASFSSDSKYVVSASEDGTIRIWDIDDGYYCKRVLKEHHGAVISAVFGPDANTVVSGSSGAYVHLWDLESQDYLRTIDEYVYPTSNVAFSMSDRYVVSKLEDTLRIYDVNENYRCIKKYKCKNHGGFRMSNSGKYVTKDFRRLFVGDINSKEYFREIGEQGWHLDYSISSDGRYVASVSGDSTIHVFDGYRDYEKVELVSKYARRIKSVSFSPEGKYIVSASEDGNISVWKRMLVNPCFLWKTESFKLLSTVSSNPHEGYRAIVGFNGEFVAWWNIENNGQIFLLKLSNGEFAKIPYPSPIRRACFSPDGKYIATGYENGTICIWDVYSQRCVRELKGHINSVDEISFSQDGRYILSSSLDKTIKVWEFMPLHELVDRVQEQFKNNPLTDVERREYYLE